MKMKKPSKNRSNRSGLKIERIIKLKLFKGNTGGQGMVSQKIIEIIGHLKYLLVQPVMYGKRFVTGYDVIATCIVLDDNARGRRRKRVSGIIKMRVPYLKFIGRIVAELSLI